MQARWKTCSITRNCLACGVPEIHAKLDLAEAMKGYSKAIEESLKLYRSG